MGFLVELAPTSPTGRLAAQLPARASGFEETFTLAEGSAIEEIPQPDPGDYAPLYVAAGSSEVEILWVTTVTVETREVVALRGQEGTEAVQHAAGTRVDHGPTPLSIVGPAGPQGNPGANGENGADGDVGPPGPDNVLAGADVPAFGAGDDGYGLLYDETSGEWVQARLADLDAANVFGELLTAAKGFIAKGSNGLTAFDVSDVASAVNYLRALASATGNAVELQAVGTDGNVALKLTPKGTGRVEAAGTLKTRTVQTLADPGIELGNGFKVYSTATVLYFYLNSTLLFAVDTSLGRVVFGAYVMMAQAGVNFGTRAPNAEPYTITGTDRDLIFVRPDLTQTVYLPPVTAATAGKRVVVKDVGVMAGGNGSGTTNVVINAAPADGLPVENGLLSSDGETAEFAYASPGTHWARLHYQ